VTQLFVAAYFAGHDWREYLQTLKTLYRTRRDTMLSVLNEHFGSQARWTEPQGGMFIWATLPDYIDTTDLLVRALEKENVAFVPGRAAYTDGRGGSSMRLNFAGVPEENIREGIRRIGKVLREQIGLFGTLTGTEIAVEEPEAPSRSDGSADPGLADVVAFPKRGEESELRRRDR
jgi:2-aminoadipate transaminase